MYILGSSFFVLGSLHFLVLRSQTGPHVMYSSVGVSTEILSYAYITFMCTVPFCIFMFDMSMDYHFCVLFVLYVGSCIIISVSYCKYD